MFLLFSLPLKIAKVFDVFSPTIGTLIQKPSGCLQGLVAVRLAGAWLVGCMNVSHEMDSNLNISPKVSYDVLECAIVILQNHTLVIL